MLFWLLATLLFLASMFAVLRPLWRPANGAAIGPASDIEVYRDQLAEIDSDLERAVISATEALSARTEVSRRLLRAVDRLAVAPDAAAAVSLPLIAAATTGVCALLVVGLYGLLAAPGTPDLPLRQRLSDLAEQRATRPSQDAAELAVAGADARDPAQSEEGPDPADLALVGQLETALQARPDDLRGHELLAQTQSQLGLWAKARKSQQQVIALKDGAATGADFLALGEYMVLATGGFVSPEAEAAIAESLSREPASPRGRYLSGLALAQGGRPDLAVRLWQGLLTEGPAAAPWIAAINAALPQVAAAAGMAMPEPDAGLNGPDQAAVAAAADLSGIERNAMIAGMVAGLSARLDRDGGSAEEWSQLIRSYGVLGQTGQAAAAWERSKAAFAADPVALALLLAAAQTAEVAN